ncbi:MAG: DNA-binding response regulator [Acidobacteria bacterium]|nr:MAG: DNA-binding response regulator [Acidobacteriota bacterium]
MRILVVEDERKVADFVKRGLQEAQHVVDAAASIAEAEDLVSGQDYDLLIIDCMLPDGDGRHFCRDLRARGVAISVLLLTAKASTADKVVGLDSGADDYVTKPFNFIELLARVRALGRRRAAVPMGQLSIADLSIDSQRHRVLVLELLVSHTEKVLTRMEIIQQVWDMNFDPNSNVVDVVIKSLRDKIDRNFVPKLIHTVRGSGYIVSTNS